MAYRYLDSAQGADAFVAAVRQADHLALDCEAAGFHRYSDRLCLLQVTVEGTTYLIDPLALDPAPLLAEVLEDPARGVVMHGPDFDLRLLRRDLDIGVRGLVDTQVCAALLGEENLGLAHLLESRLGVRLSKKYQRADWAERPLSAEMLQYAASDTLHLDDLAEQLLHELDALGRLSWAEEEWRALERVGDAPSGDEEPVDPVTRVKGARELSPRAVTALREALAWRDAIARRRDRATFRVVGDRPLLEAVIRAPRHVDELANIQGFPGGLARDEGPELLERFADVLARPEQDLVPYPRPPKGGRGRPSPELEAMVNALKQARNQVADDVGLARGTLLANAVIEDVARTEPSDLEGLQAVDGMRAWKAGLVGERFLSILSG